MLPFSSSIYKYIISSEAVIFYTGQPEALSMSPCEKKKKCVCEMWRCSFIDTKDRLVVARYRGLGGEMGEGSQRFRFLSCKISHADVCAAW